MICQAKLRSVQSDVCPLYLLELCSLFFSPYNSLFFNPYHKNHLASSDYDGCVCIWDINTGTKMINHHEHSKRVWSVVYNPAEPTMYASGSDDCSGKVVQQIKCIIILYSIAADSSPFLPLSLAVKLWCTSRPHSIYKIDAKANVCSVRFHPVERHYLAYGSAGQHTLFSVVIFKKIFFFFPLPADHAIHYIDLRNPGQQLFELKGHRKAVSYVHFISTTEVISA